MTGNEAGRAQIVIDQHLEFFGALNRRQILQSHRRLHALDFLLH